MVPIELKIRKNIRYNLIPYISNTEWMDIQRLNDSHIDHQKSPTLKVNEIPKKFRKRYHKDKQKYIREIVDYD